MKLLKTLLLPFVLLTATLSAETFTPRANPNYAFDVINDSLKDVFTADAGVYQASIKELESVDVKTNSDGSVDVDPSTIRLQIGSTRATKYTLELENKTLVQIIQKGDAVAQIKAPVIINTSHDVEGNFNLFVSATPLPTPVSYVPAPAPVVVEQAPQQVVVVQQQPQVIYAPAPQVVYEYPRYEGPIVIVRDRYPAYRHVIIPRAYNYDRWDRHPGYHR